MLEVHSTKKFLNLACAHAQWFDKNEDGTPGSCSSIHGYDRSVSLTFSGNVDDHGWLVPFGKLKAVKEFLEFYFDHTTVLPADDPRIESQAKEILQLTAQTSLLGTLRILPYGVSMEMSSLFIWEHVNPYIKFVTNGRAYVSKVESIEHERNSAFITVDKGIADMQGRAYFNDWSKNHKMQTEYESHLLPKKNSWDWISPDKVIALINGR